MGKTIITAGHICVDITPSFLAQREQETFEQLLRPGRLIHVGAADVHTGGSVANTGLALKLLGNSVRLLGKIGQDDFGRIVQQSLQEYDAADSLIVDPEDATSYSIVIAPPEVDRIFLHAPGANDSFYCDDIEEDMLSDAAVFHFGYPPLMKRMYENEGKELVDLFSRAKSKGLITSLDMANVDSASASGQADWEGILRSVLPYVDIFVPSFEELCFMLDRPLLETLLGEAEGRDITEMIDPEREGRRLAERALALGCKVVLLKCGVSGMYYCTASANQLSDFCGKLELSVDQWSDCHGVQRCFRADRVLSGTGAGDTSIAAFLTAILSGYDPKTCVALAAAEGACSVTEYDALSGIRPIHELLKKIHEGWPTI